MAKTSSEPIFGSDTSRKVVHSHGFEVSQFLVPTFFQKRNSSPLAEELEPPWGTRVWPGRGWPTIFSIKNVG